VKIIDALRNKKIIDALRSNGIDAITWTRA
jgi:hypothetical protein